ncbi:hypothetical protein M422DRAFT_248519 [Sphaerobolus stellatus SS14]|uniref:Uncharacterized protein n=1 Tax=Sphaerobolus stellatus (strain SS14) TaxID=990650 RepID=A0A0C9VW10_SPHS4|nr:hypothetical protein M422DRAFT_248519 [Sphaerobolus stellatus SS14]
MRRIIEDPGIILGPSVTYKTGSFDGLLWDRPEVFYKIQSMLPTLPHLQGLDVAFFRGAHTTWSRFIADYEVGGTINGLSAEQWKMANMEATNDANEGVLGTYHQAITHFGNMSESTFNSKTSYLRNDTGGYMKTLDGENRTFLRNKARKVDASGIQAKKRKILVAYEQEVAVKNREQDKLKQERKDQQIACLDGLDAICTLKDFESRLSNLKNEDPDNQLAWHRRINEDVPKKKDVSRKPLKIEALRTAVIQYTKEVWFGECGNGFGHPRRT